MTNDSNIHLSGFHGQEYDFNLVETTSAGISVLGLDGRSYELVCKQEGGLDFLREQLPELNTAKDLPFKQLQDSLKAHFHGAVRIKTDSIAKTVFPTRPIEEVRAQVDEYLSKAAKHWGFTGSVGVVFDGKDLENTPGYGKPDHPITENTTFNLASVTKYLTAIAVMKLQETYPHFDIDKPIIEFLPASLKTQESWSKITARHLLTHRSGLPNHMKDQRKKYEAKRGEVGEPLSTGEIIDLVKDLPLTGEPGEGDPQYNNTAFLLLGEIIEQLSGKSYEDYLTQNVLPGEMKSTGLNSTESAKKGESFAEGFIEDTQGECFEAGPSGGVYSTVSDMVRLHAELSAGTILSESSLKQLEQGEKEDALITKGLGCDVSRELGTPIVSKGGGLPGFTTCLTRIPERGHFIVVLGNSPLRSEKVAYDLSRILLGMKGVSIAEQHLDKVPIADYVGRFEDDTGGWPPFSLKEVNGSLHWEYDENNSIKLIPQGDNAFIQPDTGNEIRFIRNEDTKKIVRCNITAGQYPAEGSFTKQ